MFTIRDDPLARAVSLMGRVTAERTAYRDRSDVLERAIAADEAIQLQQLQQLQQHQQQPHQQQQQLQLQLQPPLEEEEAEQGGEKTPVKAKQLHPLRKAPPRVPPGVKHAQAVPPPPPLPPLATISSTYRLQRSANASAARLHQLQLQRSATVSGTAAAAAAAALAVVGAGTGTRGGGTASSVGGVGASTSIGAAAQQEFRTTGASRRAQDSAALAGGVPALPDGVLPGMDILRGVYTLTQINNLTIDSLVFRLHCNATVILLVTFSIAVTTRQYVGNPIDCVHTRDIPEDVLNTYCWIHSTYTVIDALMKTPGSQVAYPGVQNSYNNRNPSKQSATKQVKYYQWVAFMLFFQAILFYTPRWLWKSWEGGKIHALMMDLDIGICSDSEKRIKKKLMVDYLWENFRYHNWWAYKYYFCELLSLLNVVGQMFLMNRFFDGAFLTFGIRVIAFLESDQEDRVDPIIEVFPKMTKCTFFKFGVSGEVEKLDAICILPLNVVNEKIYVFLWFWFIILSGLTFLTLLYRIITILSPRMRVYLLRMRYRLIRKEDVDLLVRKSKMGDWFLFYMLGENVDSVIFRDVIHELSSKLRLHQMDYAFKGDENA